MLSFDELTKRYDDAKVEFYKLKNQVERINKQQAAVQEIGSEMDAMQNDVWKGSQQSQAECNNGLKDKISKASAKIDDLRLANAVIRT